MIDLLRHPRPALPVLLFCFSCHLLFPASSEAQRLPIRRFDVRDGLAHSRVPAMIQDGHGYLWFGTWEGLSRFDGERFVNYGAREGLSHPILFDLAEDHQQRLWAATWGDGVARLVVEGDKRPRTRFHTWQVGPQREDNLVEALLVDREDQLWCLTSGGAFRGDLEKDSLTFQPVDLPGNADAGLVTREGRLFLAIGGDLFERVGGQTILQPRSGTPAGAIVALAEASDGSIMIGTQREVFQFRPSPLEGGTGSFRPVPLSLDPTQRIRALVATRAGVLWVGTWHGLIRYENGRQTVLGRQEGLSDDFVRSLMEDNEGNLWIGSNQLGVSRFTSSGIVSYTANPDDPDEAAVKLVEGIGGEIVATTERNGMIQVRGSGVVHLPGSEAEPFTSPNYRLTQDSFGDWWMGTDAGLYRFRGPDLDFSRGRRLTRKEGIPEREIVGVYFDPVQRDLWAGTAEEVLYRIRPGNRPQALDSLRLGKPAGIEGLRTMLKDEDGNLWLAGFVGLGRVFGGAFHGIEPSPGLPNNEVRSLFLDHRGRLWLGLRFGGVSVTEDPGAPVPHFRNYSEAEGLGSSSVWSIAEDDSGRIYLGTGRGLDQLSPATGEVRHFTTADGLAGETISSCLRDRRGRIWLATSGGLSLFDAGEPRPAPVSPPVYLSRVSVAGEEVMLPDHGASHLTGLEIGPSHSELLIDYVGLYFRGNAPVRYSTRLSEGEWSPPSEQRTIEFSRLAPGRYTFEVRALLPGGEQSPSPARVEFRVLRPVWQRAWFLSLVGLLLGGAAFGVHRIRLRSALAMERIRRQIAIDLHDDIGSGLSEIAILNEVAKRGASPEAVPLLDQTARLARSMRESMSDIVWAVDPRRDRLIDLTRRMRQAAFNLLEAAGVRVDFRAPTDEALERINLPPDVRRHLLLMFKESLTNIARHACASRVDVDVALLAGELSFRIRDDGRGFDTAREHEGQGLRSLKRRGEEIGGRVSVESSPGDGACVSVRVRLPRGMFGGG